ncbi:Ribosomal lysine N-methyltransferase 4 [Didymosphaeria variabile]|uniref:Ribosomal lysine N-methyltransferase 4 n=1 Tax=Didymosphaeria variabile TaxID=1932322 RepID=A0A9W8XMD5_9PLEO|nr:Ribosomal lysine N-methyltransferase 4 [Didymosphaeria variabile]KAJ4354074.1 Ribosomal lysine N-methyltransferase 4 [Didymosphaeria variabile]
MDPFNEASHVFLDWLKRSGAEISPKIELKDLRNMQAGRGVVAIQNIDEDEVLFRIPRSAILSVENSILSNEIPKATFDALGPWLSLILVMLYEYFNKDASNWAPYFRVLPNEFNTLMFWSEDELAELQASAVVHKIGRQSADENFKNELLPVVKEFAQLVFAGDERAQERAAEMESEEGMLLMHKMGSLIMAYAFDVEPAQSQKEVDEEGYASEDEDEALPKGMVPMADMLNADADRNNARLFYEEQSLSMKALKAIQTGEEIFNDYGPLPRSDLLRRYGYVTDNYAQYDVVEIPFDLVAQTASAANVYSEARFEYLAENDLIETGYDICASEPFTVQESVSPELIVVVETLLLDNEAFEHLKRKGKLPKPERSTTQGAEFLHRLVQVRLQQYTTTLDEDNLTATQISLKGEATSKERRYAIAKQVRIGEKKILKQAEEALEQVGRDLVNANGSVKRPAEEEEVGRGKKRAR